MKGKWVRDSPFYHMKKISKMMTDWCMKVIKAWVSVQSFLFLQASHNPAAEIKPERLQTYTLCHA